MTEAKAADAAALVPEILAAVERLAELVQQHDAMAARVLEANRELRQAGRGRVTLRLNRVWPNDPNGERVSLLGTHMKLPGPRGACATLSHWRAEVERATAA